MLNECMEVFKKLYDLEGDDLLLDNYVPDEGIYMLYEINQDSFLRKTEVPLKFDKSHNIMEGIENIYYEDLIFYDYYSQILNTNKSLGKGKKILSNNYLSFFVKNDKLKNGDITDEIIDSYYQQLKNPLLKYGKAKESKNIYLSVENKIGKPNEELINKIQCWIKKNIYELTKEIQTKKYIKIFFCLPDKNQTETLYLNESNRYFIPNIYNKNIYNMNINGMIYGLPNYNMGLNAKKPYLENKDRKITLPTMLDIDTALLEKKLFDYLLFLNMKGKKNLYFLLDEYEIIAIDSHKSNLSIKNAIYIRTEREKTGLSIKDCEYISSYHSELDHTFYYKNVLNLSSKENDKVNLYNHACKKKYEVENIINYVCFHGYLKRNYDNDDMKITTLYSGFSDLLRKTRKLLFEWFYLKDQIHLDTFVYQDMLTMIKKEREIGNIYSAKQLLNLRISLIDFINNNDKEEMKMNDVYNNLNQYLNCHDPQWTFKNDDEYYFGVGQLVDYLISKSKAKNITWDLVKPILSSKNDQNIKDEIVRLLKRYGYSEVYDKRTRFSQLVRAVSNYIPNTSINMSLIISGMLFDNLIYKKNVKGENEYE